MAEGQQDTQFVLPSGSEQQVKPPEDLPYNERPEYKNSVLVEKLAKQKDEQQPQLVAAFTDIDGTYVYKYRLTDVEKSLPKTEQDRIQAEQNKRYAEVTTAISEYLTNNNYPIIAVTGRDLKLVQAGQQPSTENLPPFDVVAGAVGTEIWIRQKDGTYVKDEVFDQYIKQNIGFDRPTIYNLCQLIQQDVSPNATLQFQPRDSIKNVTIYQENAVAVAKKLTNLDSPQDYKISFNFNGNSSTVEQITEAFRKQFDGAHLSQIKLVVSHDKQLPNGQTRYNLDVVPVTKREAIDYMTKTYGCMGIVAGDSGNDTDMLLEGANAGVVVGGSKGELNQVIKGLTADLNTRTTEYFRVTNKDAPEEERRLLFVDPSELRKGPESLIKAARAFHLLSLFRKKQTP